MTPTPEQLTEKVVRLTEIASGAFDAMEAHPGTRYGSEQYVAWVQCNMLQKDAYNWLHDMMLRSGRDEITSNGCLAKLEVRLKPEEVSGGVSPFVVRLFRDGREIVG